jgi:hypothetical protein
VPGACGAGYKLRDAAVSLDQEVGRDAYASERGKESMGGQVEGAGKQALYVPAAELAWRQADVVDHQQVD